MAEGPRVTAPLSLQGPLLRWLKVNFSEAFIAWVHVKALRVFVESVLRLVGGGARRAVRGGVAGSSSSGATGLPSCLPRARTSGVQ